MPVACHACVQSINVAKSYFKGVSGVEVVEMPINDGWLRDWGPTVSVAVYIYILALRVLDSKLLPHTYHQVCTCIIV